MSNNKFENVVQYIENTNLGILFTAKHNNFIATFKKQYHVWSVTFESGTSKIIEEAISPNNKLHEPSFIDLIYEFSVGHEISKLDTNEIQTTFPLMTDAEIFRLQTRGKRFESLGVDKNIISTIASFPHTQQWKLWSPKFLD